MTDWTSGYVTDIGYTFGYYTDLNPLRIRLAFLNDRLVCPEIGSACELGFGQGLSVNIHAAASPARWYGTDFNPSHAGFAQELAFACGSEARLFDQAFADFCCRTDLPDFDYIGLHGIWSWISDENRGVIVDFIRRKLKVGGVLYISYNTLPGWAAFAPMRHLLTEHVEIIGSEGYGILNCINGALEFADRLLATNPAYARANPNIAKRVQSIKDKNRNYLAHEYFNRDWCPMHFSTLGDWLSSAKLSFACSANPLDHVDGVNLTNDQRTFLKDITDPMFRETVRDFMVNQQFRRDYWVKGPRRLSPFEQGEELRRLRLILATPVADVTLKASGAVGETALMPQVYTPVLEALADHQVHTLAEVERTVTTRNVSFPQLVQALLVLAAKGDVALAQDEAQVATARGRTDRLNAYFLDKARGDGDLAYLASPVTGGGVSAGRFPQLFLLARSRGRQTPAEWARFTWEIFSAQGQAVVKDGKRLQTPEENLAELTARAQEFADKRLPILQALQIA